MKTVNPVTDFKIKPIRFGWYDIRVDIGCGCCKRTTIHLSEHFSRSEWNKMSAVDQHNALDNITQDYAESITTMGWSLVRNV